MTGFELWTSGTALPNEPQPLPKKNMCMLITVFTYVKEENIEIFCFLLSYLPQAKAVV